MSDKLSKIIKSKCIKKNEERWKFVYKRTIKQLQSNFSKKITKIKSKSRTRNFLKFYFQEESLASGLPLNYYLDPLIQKYKRRKCKVKDDKRPKSINTWYLGLIFKSRPFTKDFFEFIEQDLLEHCMEDIPDKFQLIFSNYIDQLESSPVGKDYFIFNKRCKLPWSFYDVEQSILSMKTVWKDITRSLFI